MALAGSIPLWSYWSKIALIANALADYASAVGLGIEHFFTILDLLALLRAHNSTEVRLMVWRR